MTPALGQASSTTVEIRTSHLCQLKALSDVFCCTAFVRLLLCEVFRMTAHHDDAAGAGAVVRKPPV
jgi:hypothetical protein